MRQYYVAKAMVGGLLGTLLQTIMVYGVAPMMAGQSMDVVAITGHACAPNLLAHLLSGSVIFPLGYVWLSSRAFSGPPVLQGMLWAGLIWFVAEVIMAPMLGVEVFSTALGGLPAALRALLGYLVYGATLVISVAAAVAAVAALIGRDATPADLMLPIGLPWIGAHFRIDALAAFFLAVVYLPLADVIDRLVAQTLSGAKR